LTQAISRRKPDCPQQREQRRPDVGDEAIGQRFSANADVGIGIRMFAFELRRDVAELAIG
jgi:hypothetical protein